MKQIAYKVNKVLSEMSKGQELLLISLLSIAYVFSILLWMETITCGWHLTDDHEFLRMIYYSQTEGRSFWDLCKEFTLRDVSFRFRPLYMPARVFSVFLFRDNLLIYYIMKALEVVASCIVLYYVGRQMSDSKVASLLFSLISLTGYQSVSWWKLGTHEMQGTVLFAISWLTLMWWIKSSKSIWAVISVVSAIPMMLYKESYMALVPFLMLFAIYYDHYVNKTEIVWTNLLETIKKRIGYFISIGCFLLIFTGYFVFVIGFDGYDMSGGDSGGLLSAYWNGISKSLERDLKWYFRFGVLFVAILLTYWEELKKRWQELIIICVFVLPQIVIYGNVGFSGHYLLPLTIAFALFFVLWTWEWKVLAGKRRWLYIFGILLVLASNGRVALREADYFRLRGVGITTALETVKELSLQKEDVKVLSAFENNTEANMTFHYWLLNQGIDNMYYWKEDTESIEIGYNNAQIVRNDMGTYTIEDMDVVVVHNHEDRHWYYDPTFDKSDFIEIPCGTLTLYVRNDAGLEIPKIQIQGLKINF